MPQPTSGEWIGMNAWQCLRSSVFTNFSPELFDQKKQDKAVQAANDRYMAVRSDVSQAYGYKGAQSLKDCLQVIVFLTPGRGEILVVASHTMKGGTSEGYPTSPKNKDKNRKIQADASDLLLGSTILDMLRQSTHARKTPEQVEAIWCVSGGLRAT